jgi:hypothetical protein
VPRLFSSGILAWGFVVRKGFQGEVSALLGLTSNASCGLRRFLVRNAFPGRGFLDLGFAYITSKIEPLIEDL